MTCSPECSKINKQKSKNNYLKTNKGKVANKRYRQSEKGKVARRKAEKKYEQSEKGKEYQKKYQKEYYKKNRDKFLKNKKEYTQNKIAELNKKYDGDLCLILKDCPNSWMEREAIMLVEYGVSYAEAMYQKIQANPVCEVTGRKDNLVIHHLDSFNTHPEKGADLDNLVRVASEIHDDFHNEYGYGNNTREQWFEFLEKNRNIYI